MDLAKQRAKRGKSKRCCNEMKQATGRVYIHVLKRLSLGPPDAVRIKNKNKEKKKNIKKKMKIIKRVLDKEFQGKTPPTIPIPLSRSASRAPPVDKSFPIGPELIAIKVRMHYRARFFSEIMLQPSGGMLTGSRGTKQQKLKFRQSRRKAF